MTMTILPVLRNTWTKLKAAALEARQDDSGQAALVIVTIVIVAAGIAISQLSLQNNRRSLEVTQAQRANFDKITNAIDVFAIQDVAANNSYLIPCPATFAGNGMAQGFVGGNSCNGVNRGIVPWVTLGLAEEDVIDVNGNYLTYIVDSTEISACNGASPTPVSLTNRGLAVPAADANYVIISHGSNGFGAFNSNSGNQVNGGGVGTNERDNCPDGGACADPDADSYRSGPPDDTIGATFFDDVVRGVSFAETFTEECLVLSEPPDEETAFVLTTETANGEQQLQQNTTRTDGSNANLSDVSLTFDDNGTPDDDTDNTRVIVFSDFDAANPTAACVFFDQPFPIIDHKVRILTEFAARNDAFDTRGGGAVLTFMSYDPDVNPGSATPDEQDDSGYVITDEICGGTNTFMGFADDQTIGARQLPSVPRFGIEIDTRAENGSTGEGTNTNQDSTVEYGGGAAAWNHIAILSSNNDHMGMDQQDTGDFTDDEMDDPTLRGDGPKCIEGVTGLGGGGGCAALANVGGQGFIEVGDNQPTDGDFHQMRVDLTYEGGGCGQDQVYVQFWFYPSDGSSDADCAGDGSTCEDLTTDFEQGASTPTAERSACVPWTGDFNDEFMRLGFSTGQPADSNIVDNFRIRRFDVFSIGKAAPAAGTLATDGTQSREIHNVNVAEDVVKVVYPGVASTGTFDSLMGVIDLDDSAAQTHFVDDRLDTGVRLISRNGTIDVQLDGSGLPDPLTDVSGVGVRGFGSTATNELDMLWVQTIAGTPDEGIYINANNPERREGLEIRFYADDDVEGGAGISATTSYERISLNLGRFSNNATTDNGDVPEEVIVRAFSGGTFLGDTVVQTCNTGSTSNSLAMFLSLDYTATPVDKIIIIPDFIDTGITVPATYPDQEYGTDFYLRGVKGCSEERSCGLTATSDCTDYRGNYPYGGMGDPTTVFDDPSMTGLITLDNIQAHFNALNTVDLIGVSVASETAWQNLEGNFNGMANIIDDGPVYVDIIPTGGLLRFNEDNDPGDDYDEGLWVGNGRIQNSAGESVEFRWHNEWNTALISFGHFGQVGGNPDPTNRYERVMVEGFTGSDGQTPVGSVTVESCADSALPGLSSTADNSAVANLTFNFPAGQTINRLVVTPVPNLLAQDTEFVINGIRMCTEAALAAGQDCDPGGGNPNPPFGSADALGDCSATFSVP